MMVRLIPLLLTLPLLVACPGQEDPNKKDNAIKPSSTNTESSKTRGGVDPSATDTLMLLYGNDPNTLNPVIANDTTSGAFMRWVVESMADTKFSNPDEWEPMLAEKWTFDEPNLEYTINLRKGILWHPAKLPDGTALPDKEFTADDVKFTFDCIVNKHVNAAHIRSYYEDEEAKDEASKIKIRVSVVDKHTVKVKWLKPYFQSLDFTMGIGIIPKHVYSVDKKGEPISMDVTSKEFAEGFNNHWANDRIIGTGQMVFHEWKKNEILVLKRNTKYWGQPFFYNQVKFKSVPNPNTALQLLLKGDVDAAGIGEKQLFIQTKNDEAVKQGRVTLHEYYAPVYRYLGFNQKRDYFKDAKVRRALSHAIPVQQIIDKLLLGFGKRLTGPFIPGGSAYDASLPELEFNLETAGKMLDEAGWKDTNKNGTRDKTIDGKMVEFKFDMMIYADAPTYQNIAEVIKENYRQIGVEVQISPVKWNLMLEKTKKKEFDAMILGWALGWKQDPYQIFHGSQAEVPDSSNSIGYKNPELDKLIETLRVTFDPAKQKELYHKIHRIIYDDQPYTFLYVDKQTGGRLSRIQNWKAYLVNPIVDCREWHSPADKARN